MNLENVYEYCLSKKGVTEHFPFDNDTLVFKVGAKMFALLSLKGFEEGNPSINLKCNPERAIELRAMYEDDILPGYHMSKVHWNTVKINKFVADNNIFEMINHSYQLVYDSLSKKIKESIELNEIT